MDLGEGGGEGGGRNSNTTLENEFLTSSFDHAKV